MREAELHVLNGPNLNLLGQREPEIYGTTTLADIEAMCRAAHDGPMVFAQTNHEGEMVDLIHAARETADGIIINPAGWTFRSVAIVDALKMFEGPVIELHISNIHARDPIYHDSLVSPVVTAVIAGLGGKGYAVAVEAMQGLLG